MSMTVKDTEKALEVLKQIGKWTREQSIPPDEIKYNMFPMAVFNKVIVGNGVDRHWKLNAQ